MKAPILEVAALAKHYPVHGGMMFGRAVGTVRAVDGIAFQVARGETLALVGESGCGKSTTARLVLRLIDPSAGTIHFEGSDITELAGEPLRKLRRRMQIVFQDPFASLNPRMTVGEILEEPLIVHGIGTKSERRARVNELLGLVGLAPYHAQRYPHEFSGGQRQRIGIARALAVEPSLIVCDEPVSALDVSIQAQILNLLTDLQDEFNLTYVFIAHDLSVVRQVSDRVAVMYLGQVVEQAPVDELYRVARHPYSAALLAAAPVPDPDFVDRRDRIVLVGDQPSPIRPPEGCRFGSRCPRARAECHAVPPPLAPCLGDAADHLTACYYPLHDGEPLVGTPEPATPVAFAPAGFGDLGEPSR